MNLNRPSLYPSDLAEVLPQDAREKLAAAARIEPNVAIGESAVRRAAVRDTIAWCRVQYPRFFKRG